MLRALLVGSLVVVLLHSYYLPLLQAQSPAAQATQIAKFKEKVTKWGLGKTVDVKTLNGYAFKGPIRLLTDDSFVISDNKLHRDVSVTYVSIKTLNGPHSLAYKIGVPAVIAGALVIAMVACMSSSACYTS